MKNTYYLTYIIIVLILIPIFPVIAQKEPIAIVDFKSRGLSEVEVQTLTDRLRDELFRRGTFIVLEREMMKSILEEQDFQLSGCTSDECLVEIGELLGARQIIGGSISKIGELYTVSARIIDVQTGEVFKVANYDHSGKLEDLLTIGMRQVAAKLADGYPEREVPRVKSPLKVDYYSGTLTYHVIAGEENSMVFAYGKELAVNSLSGGLNRESSLFIGDTKLFGKLTLPLGLVQYQSRRSDNWTDVPFAGHEVFVGDRIRTMPTSLGKSYCEITLNYATMIRIGELTEIIFTQADISGPLKKDYSIVVLKGNVWVASNPAFGDIQNIVVRTNMAVVNPLKVNDGLEEWIELPSGMRAEIRGNGIYDLAQFDPAREAEQQFVKWSVEMDGKSGVLRTPIPEALGQ